MGRLVSGRRRQKEVWHLCIHTGRAVPEGMGSDWEKGLSSKERGNLLGKSRRELGFLETDKTKFFLDLSIRIQSFELGTRNFRFCCRHKTRGR